MVTYPTCVIEMFLFMQFNNDTVLGDYENQTLYTVRDSLWILLCLSDGIAIFLLLYSFWIEVPGSYPQDTCDGVIRTPVRVAIHETKIVCATKLFPLFSFSVSLKQPIITGIVHILHPNCKKLFGIPNMTEIIWWFHFFFVIFRYLHAIKTVTVLINHL